AWPPGTTCDVPAGRHAGQDEAHRHHALRAIEGGNAQGLPALASADLAPRVALAEIAVREREQEAIPLFAIANPSNIGHASALGRRSPDSASGGRGAGASRRCSDKPHGRPRTGSTGRTRTPTLPD